MKFLVVTNAPTLKKGKRFSSYAPYVREMELWFGFVDEVAVVSPTSYPDKILLDYFSTPFKLFELPFFSFKNVWQKFKSLIFIPVNFFQIFRAFIWADHIHLRCPGNVGLLGCIVQIFFPQKPKTAKYAGNWDPKSEQPWSYRFQKWILENSILTRNMKVLVYGDWKNQGKNVVPFFTASYSETEKTEIVKDFASPYQFIFVGTLSQGKRPLVAVQIVHQLLKDGFEVHLDIYGEGEERKRIENYINENYLSHVVILHGNRKAEIVKDAYLNSHFSLLPSKSEGWPKTLAEAMFFGCIPVATAVSCVSWMLGEGERGIIIEPDVTKATETLKFFLDRPNNLQQISRKAAKWSRFYTLEKFEAEIGKFL